MKIGIVGAGQVGATAAYAMTMRGVGSEIVLVWPRRTDATPWAYPIRVRAGEAADLGGAGIVVLAAGAAQKPGETAECCSVRDVALSLPRVLGAGGVVTTFMPSLDAGEHAASAANKLPAGAGLLAPQMAGFCGEASSLSSCRTQARPHFCSYARRSC